METAQVPTEPKFTRITRSRGRRPTQRAENRLGVLENLTIDYCIRVINGKDEQRKFELAKVIAPKMIARRIQLDGTSAKGGGDIKILIVNAEQTLANEVSPLIAENTAKSIPPIQIEEKSACNEAQPKEKK